ncbi:hypothetical protein [uncultured Nonlabens sp.]|uniref:hypothetical protein n=1 Tax=uncultured Nonlabens sp. TaxID=859306 RepID=UPI0026192D42|nr:hypothetical protein [uncultured Nonlabens sp.]
MKTFYAILLCLLTCLSEYSDFELKIIDANGNSMESVHIYVKDLNLTLISNSDGKVILPVNRLSNNTKISFSYIGFKTYITSLSDLSKKNKTVIMVRESTLLESVVLKPLLKNPKKIIENVLLNYYDNFPSKPFATTGFLRYTERTKNEFRFLSEAAIKICDPGFNFPSQNISVDFLETRKSLDFRELDSIFILSQHLRKTREYSFKRSRKKALKENEFYSKAQWNEIIRVYDQRNFEGLNLFDTRIIKPKTNKKGKINLKNNNFINQHSFKLDSVIHSEDNTIYKIKILPTTPPSKVVPKWGDSMLPFGYIYVNANNYAILEMEYTLIINPSKNFVQTFEKINGSKISLQYKIKFKELHERMYPYYISYWSPLWHNATLSSTDKNKNDQYYYNKIEILLSETVLESNEVTVNKKDLNINNNVLFNKNKYNPEFWKNYNVLLETEEEAKMIKDLEKKMSLKEQFEKN